MPLENRQKQYWFLNAAVNTQSNVCLFYCTLRKFDYLLWAECYAVNAGANLKNKPQRTGHEVGQPPTMRAFPPIYYIMPMWRVPFQLTRDMTVHNMHCRAPVSRRPIAIIIALYYILAVPGVRKNWADASARSFVGLNWISQAKKWDCPLVFGTWIWVF